MAVGEREVKLCRKCILLRRMIVINLCASGIDDSNILLDFIITQDDDRNRLGC